jgi:hypothetical protein
MDRLAELAADSDLEQLGRASHAVKGACSMSACTIWRRPPLLLNNSVKTASAPTIFRP